jgi:hypothetical protein
LGIHGDPMANFNSTTNTKFHAYYVPEFEMVLRRYRDLEHEKPALDAFVNTQRKIASQIMAVRRAQTFCRQLCQPRCFPACEMSLRLGGDVEADKGS